MGARRWVSVALGGGALLLCAWCSMLSAVGGWVLGGDIAARDAKARFAATATADSDLPPLGVLVTRLDKSGPAAQAGVFRGDVIVAIDGVTVEDARDLRDALQRMHPGDRPLLTIDRGASPRDVPVELAAFPDDAQRAYLGIYYTARAEEPGDL